MSQTREANPFFILLFLPKLSTAVWCTYFALVKMCRYSRVNSYVISWGQVWYLIVSFPDLCRLSY